MDDSKNVPRETFPVIRECSVCKRNKPIEDFYLRVVGEPTRMGVCKHCYNTRTYQLGYRDKLSVLLDKDFEYVYAYLQANNVIDTPEPRLFHWNFLILIRLFHIFTNHNYYTIPTRLVNNPNPNREGILLTRDDHGEKILKIKTPRGNIVKYLGLITPKHIAGLLAHYNLTIVWEKRNEHGVLEESISASHDADTNREQLANIVRECNRRDIQRRNIVEPFPIGDPRYTKEGRKKIT